MEIVKAKSGLNWICWGQSGTGTIRFCFSCQFPFHWMFHASLWSRDEMMGPTNGQGTKWTVSPPHEMKEKWNLNK
jgi:hypothetical protein